MIRVAYLALWEDYQLVLAPLLEPQVNI